jgi:response regulator RpfG family c-di-GMP phosphodiesterase
VAEQDGVMEFASMDEELVFLRHKISILETELSILRDGQLSALSIGIDDDGNEYDLLKTYSTDLLTQLESVLSLQKNAANRQVSAMLAAGGDGCLKVISALGVYADQLNTDLLADGNAPGFLDEARESGQILGDRDYTCHFQTRNGHDCLIRIECTDELSELDKGLLLMTAGNASVDFENIYTSQDIVDAQKEVIQTLGDVVESRSHETANHTARVAEYSFQLARLAGLSLQEARVLQFAAPMHDVGKIGIPDSILNKRGKLTHDEMNIIKSHTTIGHAILAKSNRSILKTAALIAFQHHEKWDGSGYPRNLRGGEIHLYGRIIAVVDVFDALSADRIYRKVLDIDEVKRIMMDGRGSHFEPRLLDLFMENIDKFLAIRSKYSVDETDFLNPDVQNMLTY